jgi:hypothetical protein
MLVQAGVNPPQLETKRAEYRGLLRRYPKVPVPEDLTEFNCTRTVRTRGQKSFVSVDVSDFSLADENDFLLVKCRVHASMSKNVRYDLSFRWNGSVSDVHCSCSSSER